MDVATDLLARAARYRVLATRIIDERTRAGLLELAGKYEVLAREMQADAPPKAR